MILGGTASWYPTREIDARFFSKANLWDKIIMHDIVFTVPGWYFIQINSWSDGFVFLLNEFQVRKAYLEQIYDTVWQFWPAIFWYRNKGQKFEKNESFFCNYFGKSLIETTKSTSFIFYFGHLTRNAL
jgi:hypothetical protein